MMNRIIFSRKSIGISFLTLVSFCLTASAQPINFAKEIHPLLKKNCLACHNSTKAKADLNLESPEMMRKGGDTGPAVVPGDADASLLYTTAAHIEEPTMPPAKNDSKARKLNEAELALLKQWINEGAKGGAVFTAAPKDWKPLTGKQPIYAAAVSPDSRYAVYGQGSQAFIYDLLLQEKVGALIDPTIKAKTAHSDAVQSVAINDNFEIATGGFRIVKRWGSTVGVPEWYSEPTPANSKVLANSSQGDRFAIGSPDGSIRIYFSSKPTEKPVIVKAHKAAVTGLTFSPDGKELISVSSDKTISRRMIDTSDESQKLDLGFPITSVAWIGNTIFSASSDGKIHRIDSGDFNMPTPDSPSLTGHSKPVIFLSAHPAETNQLISAGEDGSVIIWNLSDGKQIRKIQHGSPVLHISVSSDGKRLATSSGKGRLSLWNLGDGKKISDLNIAALLEQNRKTAEKRLALAKRQVPIFKKNSTEAEKKVAEENTTAEKAATTLVEKLAAYEKARHAIQRASSDEKRAIAFQVSLPEKDPAKAAANKKVADSKSLIEKEKSNFEKAEREWQVAIRNVEHAATIAGKTAETHIAALQQQRVAEEKEKLFQKEIDQKNEEIKKRVEAFELTSIAFSADAKILAVSLVSGELLTFSSDSGQYLGTKTLSEPYFSLIGKAKREFLAITKTNRVVGFDMLRRWSQAGIIGDGENPELLPHRVTALDYSPDGFSLATGSGVPSRSGELKVWNTIDGSLRSEKREAHRDTITCLAYSPNGSSIATAGSDKLIRVWSANTLERTGNLEGHSGHVHSISWNHDELTLASGSSDKMVKIWDLAEASEKQKVEGFEKEITAVSYQPWTDNLLIGSGDGVAKFSNQPLPEVSSFIHTATISPDGEHLVAGDAEGNFYQWNASRKLVKKVVE